MQFAEVIKLSWKSLEILFCPSRCPKIRYRAICAQHSGPKEHRNNPPTRCASGTIVALPQGTPVLTYGVRKCNAPRQRAPGCYAIPLGKHALGDDDASRWAA